MFWERYKYLLLKVRCLHLYIENKHYNPERMKTDQMNRNFQIPFFGMKMNFIAMTPTV